MINISLTDFVDFVCKAGVPKLTKVSQIKTRDEYAPPIDFYRALRQGLIDCHRSNLGKKHLNQILLDIKDSKKIRNYTEAINGYKKFWGRKKIEWFDPANGKWTYSDLQVKLNPELGLDIDGKFFVVKLYFKDDGLNKMKIEQILSLMESQLRKKAGEETVFAVLDVKNGKLFTNDERSTKLMPLLEGEAESFVTIWNRL